LYGTVGVLVVAYLIRFLTQSVQGVDAALTGINPHLEEAARSLAAFPWRVLRRVLAPLVRPTLFAVWALVFISALKELDATLLRQDHGAPGHRRIRAAPDRRDHDRRPAGLRRRPLGSAGGARRGHGLSGLRVVPAPHRGGERRLRASAPGEGGRSAHSRPDAGPRGALRLRGPLSSRALRRPAATGGPRPRARPQAHRPALGRTVQQPGPRHAGPDAGGGGGNPPAHRHDGRAGHARPR